MIRGRTTYRHGDLRRALLDAGTAMARAGGPDAVVLREATRQAGVAPNAAYRHFADRHELLHAVCASAHAALADTIQAEVDAIPPGLDGIARARARLRAIGTGYLRFARAEPGLFHTAFSMPEDGGEAWCEERAGACGQTELQILTTVLDELAAAGALAPDRREGAEFVVWATLHGLAMLLLDGPLRTMDAACAVTVEQRVLTMIEQGL